MTELHRIVLEKDIAKVLAEAEALAPLLGKGVRPEEALYALMPTPEG